MARAETKMVNVKAEFGHKHILKMGFRHIVGRQFLSSHHFSVQPIIAQIAVQQAKKGDLMGEFKTHLLFYGI